MTTSDSGGRWDAPFDEIRIPGTKPKPEPDAQVLFVKMVFDTTLLGYLCWTEDLKSIAWYPTARPEDTGWSIVAWVEDQLISGKSISDIISSVFLERDYTVDEVGRDLHMNVASDAAIDHRL